MQPRLHSLNRQNCLRMSQVIGLSSSIYMGYGVCYFPDTGPTCITSNKHGQWSVMVDVVALHMWRAPGQGRLVHFNMDLWTGSFLPSAYIPFPAQWVGLCYMSPFHILSELFLSVLFCKVFNSFHFILYIASGYTICGRQLINNNNRIRNYYLQKEWK